jgi:hypothetical protein
MIISQVSFHCPLQVGRTRFFGEYSLSHRITPCVCDLLCELVLFFAAVRHDDDCSFVVVMNDRSEEREGVVLGLVNDRL